MLQVVLSDGNNEVHEMEGNGQQKRNKGREIGHTSM